MVHRLNVMDDYLDHAQTFERTRGIEPGKILAERLAPDMLFEDLGPRPASRLRS
jgi:hypothetical protein